MSMATPTSFAIPEATERVARKAFRKPSAVMRLRDEFGVIYQDEEFAMLFGHRGQPALSPGRLAMVSVMQYMEGLSDRQAADAVRGRIDWKYALGLALDDEGFDASVLSEFRDRLLTGGQETRLLEHLLVLCRDRNLLKTRGRQRTDSTHVLGAVRQVNRLELMLESVRHALDAVAQVAPLWLRPQVTAAWFDRYGPRVSDFRLPAKESERTALALQVGCDGYHLLTSLYVDAPPALWALDAVQALRQIWVQQYYRSENEVRWRELAEMPPGEQRIVSPHDLAVRFSSKRSLSWVGYKSHLTETCDADTPHLIVHVHTTPSTEPDAHAFADIQQALVAQALAPAVHLVDSGYASAEQLVESQKQGIEMVSPMLPDTRWQAQQPDGYGLDRFAIDFDSQTVTCPQGHVNKVWSVGKRREQTVIRVQFDQHNCLSCPDRVCCTTAQTRGRSLQFYPQPIHQALQQARQREQTADFRKTYAARAGIEGTIAQAVRTDCLRQARYIGLAKTHLQQILTAVAVNCARLADWFSPTYRRKQTPLSPFVAFCGTT